jgi:hypothetical protein
MTFQELSATQGIPANDTSVCNVEGPPKVGRPVVKRTTKSTDTANPSK